MQVNSMPLRERRGATFPKSITSEKLVSLGAIEPIKAYIDFAAISEEGDLAIVGWVFDPECQVEGLAFLQKGQNSFLNKMAYTAVHLEQDLGGVQMADVSRPDVAAAMSAPANTQDDRHGFVLVIPRYPPGAELALTLSDGRYAVLPFVALKNLSEIKKSLHRYCHHSAPQLLSSLRASFGEQHALTQLVAELLSRHPHLPQMVEHPATLLAAVDVAYPLGDAGIMIFGWKITPSRQPSSITLWGEGGEAIDVTDRFTPPLFRADVDDIYRSRFSQMDAWCGFACFAPMPSRPGDARALCFDFDELGKVWLKVPTDKIEINGVGLVKELLGKVPSPEQMRHKLYELFSSGLGKAVETVSRDRPSFNGRIEEQQYGTPHVNPEISVIVPLYGRFDFIRHQLAQFTDDADFANIDLIYVVDDPSILSHTLELAARYQELFNVPFRVVSYGENRGFAGANNIGASVARGKYLTLVNSDVIPQHTGWLSMLKNALETLPDAGAVGPLLQFSDNSIQHAGMYPRRDVMLPGFLLNTHKNMGMAWHGNDAPTEHPMLTAACLMIKTQDYHSVGGFDEGYVIGDFEDSDLCMALRKRGMRLWLAPEAKLWHLERQSQNLGEMVGQRQMVTLFNGWRYSEKIRSGIIADPLKVKVQE